MQWIICEYLFIIEQDFVKDFVNMVPLVKKNV